MDRSKTLLAAGLASGALAFGAFGTALAQESTPTPTPTPREQAPSERDRGDRPGHPCPEEEGGSSGSSSDTGAAQGAGEALAL